MASTGNDKWPAIKAECPTCKAPHRFYPFEYASEFYKRTCRKCLTKWSIMVTPLKQGDNGTRFDKVEWTKVAR
jgi:hypothetical protein